MAERASNRMGLWVWSGIEPFLPRTAPGTSRATMRTLGWRPSAWELPWESHPSVVISLRRLRARSRRARERPRRVGEEDGQFVRSSTIIPSTALARALSALELEPLPPAEPSPSHHDDA